MDSDIECIVLDSDVEWSCMDYEYEQEHIELVL